MHKLLSIIIALTLCAPAFSALVLQSNDEVPLHQNFPPGNNPHAPVQVPISCYLMSSASSVILYSATITTSAHVELENTSTGLTYSCNNVISSVPVPISLFGPGEYMIKLTLPTGVMYYGMFVY